jgi:hypothetical protein
MGHGRRNAYVSRRHWCLVACVALCITVFGTLGMPGAAMAKPQSRAAPAIRVTMQVQPVPTVQPADGPGAARGGENNPREQAAAIGMLLVVVLAVVLHRVSLRRRSRRRPDSTTTAKG